MIPVSGFQGKTVAVFGLGRTGLTAARALKAGGAELALWDEKPEARAKAKEEGFALVDLKTADWSGFEALMLSPGVPLTHPEPHWTVGKARAAGVEILGDIELFARTVAAAPAHKRPKIAAITGSNGKSTTTALLGHICARAGKDTQVGGNIGVGVLGLDDMHGGAVYVLEMSSYQLDLTSSLKPDAAVLLNISPDHLERHGGLDGYVAAKRRVLLNQGKGDTAVIGVDDPWCQRICTEITAANRRTIRMISAQKSLGRGIYALQGLLYDATGDRVEEVCDLTRARSLPGRHNWQNAAAAYAAARALGVSAREAADGLMTFPGLAHRMETVGQIGRVRFVNDSKATNADAARQALSSYPKVYWIAGGQAKTGGISSLVDLFPRVARAYLIGDAAEEFAATLKGKAPVVMSGDLEAAVAKAYADAAASGQDAIVLLSPAGASFDHYTDFEARGEAFRAAVNQLAVRPARELWDDCMAIVTDQPHAFTRTDSSAPSVWWWTADHWLFGATALLIFAGVVLSFTSSPAEAARLHVADPFHFAIRQSIFGVGAVIMVVAVSMLSAKGVRRAAVIVYAITIVMMLALPLIGHSAKGAARWIEFDGFTIQPSEFMKPALIVLCGWMFAEGQKGEGVPGVSIAFVLYGIAVTLLLIEPDVGQTILVTIAFGAAFFMAGVPIRWILGMGGAALAGSIGLYFAFQHVANRVHLFLHKDGDSGGHQVDKALEAIANGGLFGRGPGEGVMKRHVPDGFTDFIYALAAEEYGLVFSLALISVLAFVVVRGLYKAMRLSDPYEQVAAAGLFVLVGQQAFINIAVNLNMIPTKGMTLPFISYGGSSMLAMGLTLGMALALTRRRPGAFTQQHGVAPAGAFT